MRLIFMGTPDFAVTSLDRIMASKRHAVLAVVTVPDKPRGRGLKLIPSPVKSYAVQHKLPIFQPESLKNTEFLSAIQALEPELFIVVAFRILPEALFNLPQKGTINLHGSLLPKYRGAAPIQWALLNGERETGVTTFFIQRQVDMGNILLQSSLPIQPDETFGELHDRMAVLGADTLLETIDGIAANRLDAKQQNDSGATAAPKINSEMLPIDFNRDAATVHNQIRAFSPKPGAYTFLNDQRMKLLKSHITDQSGPVGEVIDRTNSSIIIACGSGSVEITEIQPEGKRSMTVQSFLPGNPLPIGARFG